MRLVDLHVHSTASDGTFTPTEVVAHAASKSLAAIALTDHDTVDGIEEALTAAARYPLTVIPGIELSCVYQGEEIHILGFYVDLNQKQFLNELENIRRIREERNIEMIRRFNDAGILITYDDLRNGHPETVITRAHFAKVLLDKGYASSMDQAFKQYLQYGGPYCMRKEKITPQKAMSILALGRAFPVLAHPLQYKLGYEKTEELIVYLKSMGLRGVEVYHSSNNQYESGRLKDICTRHQLFPTGGSDFHGKNKPDIDLGCGRGGLRVSALLLEDIKAELNLSDTTP